MKSDIFLLCCAGSFNGTSSFSSALGNICPSNFPSSESRLAPPVKAISFFFQVSHEPPNQFSVAMACPITMQFLVVQGHNIKKGLLGNSSIDCSIQLFPIAPFIVILSGVSNGERTPKRQASAPSCAQHQSASLSS